MNKRNVLDNNLRPSKANYSIRKLLKQRWLIVVIALMLTGLGAALTGVLFKAGIDVLNDWRFSLLEKMPTWLVLPVMGGIGGLLSSSLITRFSPAASGSGVSHIMAFLRHRKVPMGLRVGLVKLLAGIMAIGSGFPLGPEGPAVQMGGSVAWKMAQLLKAPISFRRVIVAAGGGAGLAAIFSAPIGGFIYVIEELLNSARPVVLLLVVVTTFWADTWADILQAIGLDPTAGGFDSNLGFQVQREYSPQVSFLPIDLGYLIVLGIIIGCLAELYCRYVLIMLQIGKNWFHNRLILKMSLCGICLGGIYAYLPNEFHEITKLKTILAEGNINISMALTIFAVLFITTGLAAASGAPGGLFYPMLILGGSIGLVCGDGVEAITGHVPSSFVFAGMGAFVSACSRTPITAMFLAFALTKDLLILKPLLISCITSFLIARLFNEHSIYERQIDIDLKQESS
ncbi:ClC family H(+)/Cl(-) exchange transporter [Prochlorococcus sp. MIT 1307]|uniref:ClC family H(+)/Cl(-) exchange transporter n=1 Tax=Prochlorococcus sp. MIT 1307 TaxID=3096219 RepID=UPI002A749121|nr:ClC family H(+)/Cl(-) exchange transporter [Prochlorococcus sp. MIT 1307]